MRIVKLSSALVCAVLILFGSSVSASAGAARLKRIHDPGHVTYSIRIHSCHARDDRKLPDPSCTPGSIDPAVTQRNIQKTICRAGWTDKVRPPEQQTERAKYRVAYPAYHIRQDVTSELDHLVPLELGGSNDITNLWAEAGKIPNPKDAVENALNAAVCGGKVRLGAAQRVVAADWLTAEKRLGISGPWCTARASYNTTYNDYDVYVHSNQPDRKVKANASNGASQTWHTDSRGYADVYLYANAADSITVRAGRATCYTTAG